MNAKRIRSLNRSLVFVVLPSVFALLAAPDIWQEWGVRPQTSLLVATLIGTVARLIWPDAGTVPAHDDGGEDEAVGD